VAKATRRRFTAKYKLKILKKADACEAHGALGELLRKEGLYTSHLALWRKQREQGALVGLAPKPRGPEPVGRDGRDERIAALTVRAERAEALLELQKKLPSCSRRRREGRDDRPDLCRGSDARHRAGLRRPRRAARATTAR